MANMQTVSQLLNVFIVRCFLCYDVTLQQCLSFLVTVALVSSFPVFGFLTVKYYLPQNKKKKSHVFGYGQMKTIFWFSPMSCRPTVSVACANTDYVSGSYQRRKWLAVVFIYPALL